MKHPITLRHLSVLLVMSISSLLHGQAYQWSNFVGNPGGLGHVDGPAAQARFYAPRGMAFDTAGNLFVADMLNHCIRRITPARVVSTFAGKAGVEGAADGAGGNARFKEPSAVVFVGGVLYVADSGNHTIRRITSTGVVSTLAGMVGVNGIANGTGVAARFRNPFGIARAVDGALLVLDSYNHTLRKVTTTGVVTTVAGQAGMAGSADGSLTEARFDHPFGLAVAADGTIFIADTRNHTIRKITPAGVVSTLAGSPGVSGMADGTGSAAMFDYPDALVLHPNGDLYVADANNCVIRKVTQAGVVTTVAGAFQQYGDADGIGTAARFQYPQGLVLDSAGRLLIADWDNHNIRRMSADLAVTTLAGPADSIGSADGMGKNARFYLPYGTSVAPSGDVFIADLANYKVRRASAGGVVTTYAGTGSFGSVDGPVATASLGYVYDTAVDAAGNVYVSDSSRTIRKIDTAGMVTTLAGTAGASGATDGMGAAARFTSPRGIAVTADGTVYVADEFAHTIRKISPAGEVTTLAGQANAGGHVNAAGAAARFFQPTDVDVDADGNVFVADSRNHRIRKISPAGEVTTVAGSGVYGNADGVGAEASFRSPTGVSLDPYGNVIVCDTFNHTLRRITPAGVVTTIGGSPLTPNANDGPDTVARFSRPMRAGIDSAGMVYVADSKNNRVMRGVPHPEIAVEEPVGIDLKDGTAVSDFGMVSIHEDVVKTFTIKSVGGAALTGLSVGVTGAHAADFEVQALAMSTLNPGYDMTFTVTYKGNVAGVRTAALKITSNDASEASFDIGLKAAAADRPVVTTAPASQVANEGDTVTFNAQGTHPNATVKFQWLKNGAKISGATAPTYQKTGLKVADAGTYTVEMTTNGATSRRTATLVVAKYLEQTHLVKVGSKLKLTASAGGPATYSWTRNNVPHSGTAATLSLASLSLSTAGTYRGYVSGPGGGPVLAGVFTVVVYDDKPQVTLAQNLPNGTVGKPYSHQIQINTQTRFSPTSYTAAKLPRGVTLNTKTGLISGMPTVAGDYEIIVTATNAFGSHSSQKKTVTITPLHTNLIGTFTGTVARQNVLNDNLGGRVDFTITSTAAISGKLTNGTKSHPFKGQLVTGGAQPMATINVTRSGQSSLELELVFNIGSQSLTLASKVKSGLIEAAVSGWRLKWKAAGAPATLSPKLFTFGLRPPTGMTGIPAGDGYGSFTLPASGLVNITGKTPDGTSFTHSTFVGPQGQIALFKTLHTPTGSLLGTLDIAPIDNGFLDQDVLEGSVSWSRPANAKSRYSPEGFGPITLTAFGGWHKLPDFAPGHVLNMLLDDKAMLTFREGGLATASINPDVPTFDLLLGNKPSLPAALSAGNPGSVRITSLNAKAGTFTGTFILEDTELRTGPAFAGKKLKRTATFSGVFTQDSMGLVGVGHFLLPEMPVDAMAPLPATTPTTTEILSGNLIMEKK